MTSIGGGAFYRCNSLTSVTIPDSVTRIGESAFSGCTSLKELIYNGTEESFKQIEMAGDVRDQLTPLVKYEPKPVSSVPASEPEASQLQESNNNSYQSTNDTGVSTVPNVTSQTDNSTNAQNNSDNNTVIVLLVVIIAILAVALIASIIIAVVLVKKNKNKNQQS